MVISNRNGLAEDYTYFHGSDIAPRGEKGTMKKTLLGLFYHMFATVLPKK